MMGVTRESKAETEGTIRRIREEWSQAVNADPLPPTTAGEVTRRMDIERLAGDSTANQQAFAQGVRECGELLTREHAIWFTRRQE